MDFTADRGEDSESQLAKRIHELKQKINECHINLTAYNYEYGAFNYIIAFNCLASEYSEIRPRVPKLLQDKTEKLKDMIEKIILENPMIKNVTSPSTRKRECVLNVSSWVPFKKMLEIFENQINIFVDQHLKKKAFIESGDEVEEG